MSRFLIAVLMAFSAVVVSPGRSSPTVRLKAPQLLHASDIVFPITSIGSGLVEIQIDLDSSGQVKNMEVVRSVPSLTRVVLTAMGIWTFAPGEVNGDPVESSLFANVVFDPGLYHPTDVPLAAQINTPATSGNAFLAPRVSKAVYPDYPINSIAAGAVVLDVAISKTGRVVSASPVQTVPSLTKASLEAVRKWTFQPATFRGVPVAANTIVAFVYRSPTISTP